jgi:hypothetical protein
VRLEEEQWDSMEGLVWTRDRHGERASFRDWLKVKVLREEKGSESSKDVERGCLEAWCFHQSVNSEQEGSSLGGLVLTGI